MSHPSIPPPRKPEDSLFPGAKRWIGKRVLVTGVCGTVGRELVRQLLRVDVAQIVGIDSNEQAMFYLQREYGQRADCQFVLGDVCDTSGLIERMRGIDVVLHAAAHKHVVVCERSPRSAVATNVLGTQSVIDAAIATNVSRVLFTSTDKAVNPTNVMGASKLLGERLMTAANGSRGKDGPIFASTRFGNILASSGSVIPVFRRQIAVGGPVTLTDTRMTRFVMTLADAVQLVLESTFLAIGGEVFVTKMHAIRIADLAQAMIDELAPTYQRSAQDIAVTSIGSLPGEKLFEELFNASEAERTLELDRYFVVPPSFTADPSTVFAYEGMHPVDRAYDYSSSGSDLLSLEAVAALLAQHQLLDRRTDSLQPSPSPR